MKTYFVALIAALSISIFSGCAGNPVPANTIDITTPRGSYKIATPKNTEITKFEAGIDTNGTVNVKFDKWASTNDAMVISKAYAGKVAVERAKWEGINQLAGSVAKGVAEGGVKGAKGGL